MQRNLVSRLFDGKRCFQVSVYGVGDGMAGSWHYFEGRAFAQSREFGNDPHHSFELEHDMLQVHSFCLCIQIDAFADVRHDVSQCKFLYGMLSVDYFQDLLFCTASVMSLRYILIPLRANAECTYSVNCRCLMKETLLPTI